MHASGEDWNRCGAQQSDHTAHRMRREWGSRKMRPKHILSIDTSLKLRSILLTIPVKCEANVKPVLG